MQKIQYFFWQTPPTTHCDLCFGLLRIWWPIWRRRSMNKQKLGSSKQRLLWSVEVCCLEPYIGWTLTDWKMGCLRTALKALQHLQGSKTNWGSRLHCPKGFQTFCSHTNTWEPQHVQCWHCRCLCGCLQLRLGRAWEGHLEQRGQGCIHSHRHGTLFFPKAILEVSRCGATEGEEHQDLNLGQALWDLICLC